MRQTRGGTVATTGFDIASERRSGKALSRWRPSPTVAVIWTLCVAWSLVCWWGVFQLLFGGAF
jgi:hypothetical protein